MIFWNHEDDAEFQLSVAFLVEALMKELQDHFLASNSLPKAETEASCQQSRSAWTETEAGESCWTTQQPPFHHL